MFLLERHLPVAAVDIGLTFAPSAPRGVIHQHPDPQPVKGIPHL